jgi:hypothetical protein
VICSKSTPWLSIVDTHDKRNIAITNPGQLRCGKAVFVHNTTVVLQPNNHFIIARGDIEYRAHLFAQRGNRAGFQVALEVDNETAWLC